MSERRHTRRILRDEWDEANLTRITELETLLRDAQDLIVLNGGQRSIAIDAALEKAKVRPSERKASGES